MQKTPKKTNPKNKNPTQTSEKAGYKARLEKKKKNLKDRILNTDLALTNYNLNMPRFFLFLSLS